MAVVLGHGSVYPAVRCWYAVVAWRRLAHIALRAAGRATHHAGEPEPRPARGRIEFAAGQNPMLQNMPARSGAANFTDALGMCAGPLASARCRTIPGESPALPVARPSCCLPTDASDVRPARKMGAGQVLNADMPDGDTEKR